MGCGMPGGGAATPCALRQSALAVLGATRLLAESYDDPVEPCRVGFALCADFRPNISEWGKRESAEVRDFAWPEEGTEPSQSETEGAFRSESFPVRP